MNEKEQLFEQKKLVLDASKKAKSNAGRIVTKIQRWETEHIK